MEQSSIERIRTATFAVEWRGYDKHEVEHFLNRIADWLETGGGDKAREEVIRGELERVGDQTAGLLASAQQGAEQIRAEADERATGTRERADAYSKETREQADREAQEIVSGAERRAREMIEGAEAEARRIVEASQARRREMETLITDLAGRHEAVIDEANRLADDLRGVTARYAAAADGDQPSQAEAQETADRVEA